MNDTTSQKPLNVALFYKEGSSDKEYRISLMEHDNGLWSTSGWNGRRGSALKEQKKTDGPVSYEIAKAAYDDVLKKQLKKGYTEDVSGAIYSSIQGERTFTGFVPQLLNTIRSDDTLEDLLNDDEWIAQEKHDGERRPIKMVGSVITSMNKEGVESALPQNLIEDVLSIGKDIHFDGEVIGERFVAFDLLEHDGENLRSAPYEKRFAKLQEVFKDFSFSGIEITNSASTTEAKKALFEALKSHQAEGIVFKKKDAAYAPGRPASGGSQMKYKFLEVCSVRVSARNQKRSVAVECFDNDGSTTIALGDITIPSNHDVPNVGDIVNVRYLYKYENGSLFQTTYMGSRTDQTLPDQLHQFKHKNTTAFEHKSDEGEKPKKKKHSV